MAKLSYRIAAGIAMVALAGTVVQVDATGSGASVPRYGIAPALNVIKDGPIIAPTKSPATSPGQGTSSRTQPFLGTLVTHGNTAAQESAAGVKVAMLEFSWASFEPSPGVFNTSYANSQAALLKQYQAAGMKVTLGLGLHYTPKWALAMPGSRMVDEYGNQSAQIDLVFNSSMRTLAEAYLAAVNKAVGLKNFWAIRVTSGGMSELLYPSNNYWAYSSGAQNGPAMPAGMARNPDARLDAKTERDRRAAPDLGALVRFGARQRR